MEGHDLEEGSNDMFLIFGGIKFWFIRLIGTSAREDGKVAA
jgi:hypothetical protein